MRCVFPVPAAPVRKRDCPLRKTDLMCCWSLDRSRSLSFYITIPYIILGDRNRFLDLFIEIVMVAAVLVVEAQLWRLVVALLRRLAVVRVVAVEAMVDSVEAVVDSVVVAESRHASGCASRGTALSSFNPKTDSLGQPQPQ